MPANKSRPKDRRVRSDPRPRHIDGAGPWNKLVNPDPDKKYVLVNQSDITFGVSYYTSLGYDPVEYKEGSTCMAAGKTCRPGENVEDRGNLLMCIDKEKHELIVQYGPDGMSGQDAIDEKEREMIKNRGGLDGMRGLSDSLGRYADIENETGPATGIY